MAQEVQPDKRLAHCMEIMEGYKVEVQLKSGLVLEGIYELGYFSSDAPEGVILKYARVIKDPDLHVDKHAPVERGNKKKFVAADELLQIVAKDVRMNPEDLSGPVEEFETDSAISRGRGGAYGRELKPWQAEDGDELSSHQTLEESVRASGQWDQFKTNEDKFGVHSTYDERLYTTTIDKKKCGISDEMAGRIAREIEREQLQQKYTKGDLTAYHIAEERGFEVDDKDMTEEDRYGAVVRDTHHNDHNSDSRRQSRAHMTPSVSGGQGEAATGPALAAPKAWGGAGAGVAAVSGRPHSATSSGGGSAANGTSGKASAPAAPTAVAAMGGLSQNFAAVAAAGAGPVAVRSVAPGTGRGSNSTSWRAATVPVQAPVTPNEEVTKALGDVTAAVPIRSGKQHADLDSFGKHADALDLALLGPGSTPPEIKLAFGKFKAEQTEKAKDAQSQRVFNELKNLHFSKSPGSGGAGSHMSPGTSVSTTVHTAPATIVVPPPAIATATATAAPVLQTPPQFNHSVAVAAPPVAAGTASSALGSSTPATTTARRGTAAPPSSAPPSSSSVTQPTPTTSVKSSLNPNAKSFVFNPNAKTFTPGPGTTAPPPVSAAFPTNSVTGMPPVSVPPFQTVPQAAASFGGKPNSQPSGGGGGPHAISLHTPVHGLHGGQGLQHTLPSAQHNGPGAPPHILPVTSVLPPANDGLLHGMVTGHSAARAGPSMTGLPNVAPPSVTDTHLPLAAAPAGAGSHPHNAPMTMASAALPSAAIQSINTAGSIPFVLTPTSAYAANGQPMAVAGPGGPNVMQTHGLMASSQVMFQSPASGPHTVRPGSMAAGGGQPLTMVQMLPSGALPQHAGFNYIPNGPQSFTLMAAGSQGGMLPLGHGAGMPMPLSAQSTLPQGQQHLSGSQGSDMGHMGRGPHGPGVVKGMVGQQPLGLSRGGPVMHRNSRGGPHGMGE